MIFSARILRSLWRKHELHSKESLYHGRSIVDFERLLKVIPKCPPFLYLDMIATSVNSSDPRLNGKPDKSAKVDEELLVSFEKICDGPHLHFKNVVNEFKRQFIENEKCHQHLVEAQGLKILSESQCIKTEIDSVSHTMQSSGFLTGKLN